MGLLSGLRQDGRYSLRSLAKTPGHTTVVVLTLAVGISATTTIFSTINALLLSPAGIHAPDQIVAIRVSYANPALDRITISPADFADVQAARDVFAAAAMGTGGGVSYEAGAIPERLYRQRVTWRWFEVFGAKPHLGRTFSRADDTPDGSRVVVLGYGSWQRLFGGDPTVVGRTMRLDGLPYEIVGVVAADYRRPNVNLPAPDLWTPLGLSEAATGPWTRFNESYDAYARLRPDVSFDRAHAFMEVVTGRVRDGEDGEYARTVGWRLVAVPFAEFAAGSLRAQLLMLMAASTFVLLIACLNTGGLAIAKAAKRARDLALHAALGASRQRLFRQALSECAMVAAFATGVGLALAWGMVLLVRRFAPAPVADRLTITLDFNMTTFVVATALGTTVLFGVLPAWRAGEQVHTATVGGRNVTASRSHLRTQSLLVASEIALAVCLLVGAGLFLRSLGQLQEVDLGFDPRGVTTATVELPRTGYDDVAGRADFYRASLELLGDRPGVGRAAVAVPIPFSGVQVAGSFEIEGRARGAFEPRPHGGIRFVSPGFFAALRIPILSGRAFDGRDEIGTEPVALIDEDLARRYWPDGDPLGKRIRRTTSGAEWARIVGVVGHVSHADPAAGRGSGVYYLPVFQHPPPIASYLVKARRSTSATAAIREAVHTVDPTRPVFDDRTMAARVSASLGTRRFAVLLLACFAAASLFLAALGIYGTVANVVGRRTREIGTRMALGARPSAVMRMVMRQTLMLVGVGLGVGLVAAIVLSWSLRTMLFGIVPGDPLSYGAAIACLLVTGLVAGYLPARRAARVDPLLAIRHE